MRRIVRALAMGLVAAIACAPALAQWHHGPRVGIGINFGFPVYAPYYVPPPYYYPPYAYYPPVVAAAPVPQQYIEQPPQAEPSPPQSSWYYCAESKGYYPYVKECPGGWQRVSPVPPGATGK